MILKKGTPVYDARGQLKYGVIKEKTKIQNGWQFYKVNWAHTPGDTRDYRADELKNLNVDREISCLNIVKQLLEKNENVK